MSVIVCLPARRWLEMAGWVKLSYLPPLTDGMDLG